MHSASATKAHLIAPAAPRRHWRAALPWLGSVVVHAAAMVGLGISLHFVPPEPLDKVLEVVLQTPPLLEPAKPIAPAKAISPAEPPKPVSVKPQPALVAAEKPAPAPAAAIAAVIALPQAAIAAPATTVVPTAPAVASPVITASSIKPSPAPTTAPAIIVHADYKTSYLRNPTHQYPSISQRLREEGTALLWVAVNASGGVDDLGLLQTSGYPRLDAEAIKTVRQWHFVPAKRGGEAVADKVSVPIEFKL